MPELPKKISYTQHGKNVVVIINRKKNVLVLDDKEGREKIKKLVESYNKINTEAKMKQLNTLLNPKKEKKAVEAKAKVKAVKAKVKAIKKTATKELAAAKTEEKVVETVAQQTEITQETVVKAELVKPATPTVSVPSRQGRREY